LGGGKSMFKSIMGRRNFTLVKTKSFSNGVVILHYQLPDYVNAAQNKMHYEKNNFSSDGKP
jgi:hypothetical protein